VTKLRDAHSRWWIAGGAVPVAFVTFAAAWALWSYPEDELGPTLTLWVAPSLVVVALVRLPTWAFRLVTIPTVLLELIFSVFGPLLLVVVLLHVAALFTRRPPPLAELRRA
jgi:hypothetical protein